jgi:hypothetical protein
MRPGAPSSVWGAKTRFHLQNDLILRCEHGFGTPHELEAVFRDGSARGELRDDLPPELFALALAGLTDLALAQHWASDGIAPALDEIPELVLGLLLGAAPATTAA